MSTTELHRPLLRSSLSSPSRPCRSRRTLLLLLSSAVLPLPAASLSASPPPPFNPVSESDKNASAALSLRVSEAVRLLDLARDFQAHGDFSRALDSFSMVIKEYKDLAFTEYARVGRALALYEVGDRDEAIAEMEDVSISLKGYPEIHAALAAALYADKHSPLLAENQFAIATLLDPHYTDISYVRETKHWPPSLVMHRRFLSPSPTAISKTKKKPFFRRLPGSPRNPDPIPAAVIRRRLGTDFLWLPLPPDEEVQPMMVKPDPDALFSGGGISFLAGNKTGRFSYGYSSFKGKRSSMEDFYETRISEVDGRMVAFFGVFDGHGGSRAAEYLKSNLLNNVSKHPDFVKDTKSAIMEAFKQTDIDYLDEVKGQLKDAGSTASTAILLGNCLYVANVGDSRVVACRSGSAIPLSNDHKPDRSDERERIENAGGFVIWAGTWRVGGVLAVSRAFGDKLLKPYVVAEPEIQEEEIEGVEFFIIASDGLWNVVSNEEAVVMVRAISDAETASRNLIQEAYHRGSNDNITCIVVRFNNP